MGCINMKSNINITKKLSFIFFFFTFFYACFEWQTSLSGPELACDPSNGVTRSLPFCRTNLPIQVRVRDLIGRLTLQEKIRLLVNNAAPVERLGIRRYEWWNEALHGVSNVGPGTRFGGAFPGATSFPQVITSAAAFNSSLWEAIGRVSFLATLALFLSFPHSNEYNIIESDWN